MNDPKKESEILARFLEQIVISLNLKKELEKTLSSHYCQRCEEPRHIDDFSNPLRVCDVCFDNLSVEERWMLMNDICEGKQ